MPPGDSSSTSGSSGTTNISITRTVPLPLETSHAKTEKVRTAVEEFQDMTEYMAAMLPSFPPHRWRPQDTTMYRMVTRAFPEDERTVKATIAREAQQKVAEAFQAWRENGRPGDRPSFGDANMVRLSHQDLDIVANDRGYGLKASFIPYDPVWFHIAGGEYQEEFLERIVDGDATPGSADLILQEDGSVQCNLTVSWDVDVYEPSDVETAVGVDLGETTLYAAAAVTDGEVEAVQMEPGREFRHHRERLDRKREQLMEQGDLRGVRAVRGERERYTEQVTNRVSREIVEFADDHRPCVIRLEDLSYYRETADNPIHDWPYAMVQEQIAYKANEYGIPVTTVDARYTSQYCRKHGEADPSYRPEDGSEFYCPVCDYEVHADVNAAINIALNESL